MKFAIILASLIFCSCGIFNTPTSTKLLPEKRNTLSVISGRYLMAVASGDLDSMARMVLWEQYLAPENNDISAALYSKVWTKTMEERWPTGAHPILGLKVDNVISNENTAKVYLVKDPAFGKPTEPLRVTVSLIWTGGGWMICGDNLFSKDGYFTNLVENNGG